MRKKSSATVFNGKDVIKQEWDEDGNRTETISNPLVVGSPGDYKIYDTEFGDILELLEKDAQATKEEIAEIIEVLEDE